MFYFNKCLFSNYFGRWTTFLHLFFSLAPHHELGSCFGRYSNRYYKGTRFHVKKSSFNQCWWKIYQLLNLDMLFNLNFNFFSLLFNLSFLFKVTNYNVCKCKRWKNVFKGLIFSNLPIMATRCKVSKKMCSTFLSF